MFEGKRPWKQTDSRTAAAGPTETTYLSATADYVASITDPGGRVTSFTYDSRGRRTHVDAPNTFDPAGSANNTDHDNITVTAYNPDGTVHETSGDQTYRVTYGYDYARRMMWLGSGVAFQQNELDVAPALALRMSHAKSVA